MGGIRLGTRTTVGSSVVAYRDGHSIVGASPAVSSRPIYFVDIVEDYPSIGGVAKYSRNLRVALKQSVGARLICVREVADRYGCADPAEPYLGRERRAIAAVAALHPEAVVVVPNFQNPVRRVAGQPRPVIINVVHDVQFCSLPRLFAADHLRWLHQAFAETRQNADQVVFVSRTTQEDYTARFGAPPRSVVINPAIDPVTEHLEPARQDFLLAVQHAGFHPHKNVSGLLQLFASLAAGDSRLTMRIAGLGGDKIEADIARLPEPLRHRVEHVGYVPPQDLGKLYRTARAFVSMSRFEGFNMAAAEAASHGTPMLLSNLPVHRELFSGRACFLDPDHPSIEAALGFLRKPAHRLWSAWEGRSACSLDSVGGHWAECISNVEAVWLRSRIRTVRPRLACSAGFRSGAGGLGALVAGTLAASVSVGANLAMASEAAPPPPPPSDCAVSSGGRGGSVSDNGGFAASGGFGGSGCRGTAGSSGQTSYYGNGGGGGGGSAGGGPGGRGGGYELNGAGGAGGNGNSPGLPGMSSSSPNAGSGGGGGGANGMIDGSSVETAIKGSDGGAGGQASTSGGAGGGGAGGFGGVYDGTTLTVMSTVGRLNGGKGGHGGSSSNALGAGSGGDGGVGLYLSGDHQTLNNYGFITGGDAGAGGTGAAAGQAGIGVVGSDVHILNSGGVISAGASHGVIGTAIAFTGGDNRLTMQNGGTVTGDISVAAGASLTFDQPGPVVLTSRLTGGGDIIQAGEGTLTLAEDVRTGNTEIRSGTLALTSGLSTQVGQGRSSGKVTFNGGTLQAAASGIRLYNPIELAKNGTVDTQANAMYLLGNITGSAALIKDGPGQLFLYQSKGDDIDLSGSHLNDYSGGTQINEGLLLVSKSEATIDALGSGPVVLAGGTLVTVASGTLGNAIQEKSGTSGGITSQLGTSLTLTGRIELQSGSTTTFGSQPIYNVPTSEGEYPFSTSPGTIVIASTTASADATSKIVLAGGTLKAATGNNALGSLTANAASTTISAGTLDFNGSSATIANLLGTGGMLTNASGTVTTLKNANFTGTISGGTTLAISGGAVTLGGTNTYTGDTLVNKGSLLVNGSIEKSSVSVGSGAVLGGSGIVGSLTANAGSFVQPGPGSAFQALNVAGDVTFAGGSTFRVKISPTGQTDSLVAGGTAKLGGATLAVNEAPGTYTNILSPFTILSAKAVQGQFGQVVSANTGGFAFVDPTVVYGPQSVTLTFVRNATPLPSVALTPNQVGPAGAIQNGAPAPPTNNTTTPEPDPGPGPGPKRPRRNPGPDNTPVSPAPASIPQVLYNAVLGQTPAGAQQAYRALAGTAYASQNASTIQASRYVSVNVLDRLFSIAGSGLDARQLLDQLAPNTTLPTFINCFAPLPSAEKLVPQNVTFWGDGFGSFGKTSGNANAAGLDHALGGFILGADAPLHGFSAPYRVGIAGGYTNDNFSTRGGGASGTAESYFGSLYGSARYGSIDVRLGTSAAAIQTTADRTVAFPGFLEKEHGRYWGNVVQGFGEVGYRFATSRYVIEPVIDAAVVHIHQDGFRESGGAAALIGYAQDTDTASTTLGVRAEAAPINGLPLIARTLLGWRHGYGNINPSATFAFASGSTPFSSSGAPIDRDALAAEAGLDWRASSRLTLGASYVGQIGARDMDNSVRGRVEYKF